jgi:hypothetical protein
VSGIEREVAKAAKEGEKAVHRDLRGFSEAQRKLSG